MCVKDMYTKVCMHIHIICEEVKLLLTLCDIVCELKVNFLLLLLV